MNRPSHTCPVQMSRDRPECIGASSRKNSCSAYAPRNGSKPPGPEICGAFQDTRSKTYNPRHMDSRHNNNIQRKRSADVTQIAQACWLRLCSLQSHTAMSDVPSSVMVNEMNLDLVLLFKKFEGEKKRARRCGDQGSESAPELKKAWRLT